MAKNSEKIILVNLNSLMRNPLVWIGALLLLDSAKPRKKRKSKKRKSTKRKSTKRKSTKRKSTKRKGRMKKGSKEAKAWGAKMKRARARK